MPSPTQRILSGIDGSTFDIDSANAQQAFTDAIAEMPSSGGELYVYPPAIPGDPYVFQSFVIARRRNLTIQFAPGAILTRPSTGGPHALFDIPLGNFKCQGARFEFDITGGVSSPQSVFLVRDRPVTGVSNVAAFYDCEFRLKQGTNEDIESFSCIRAEGLGSSGRRGLIVNRCRFVLEPGQEQASAWSAGGEPMGVCGVRTSDSRGTIAAGNSWCSGSLASKGDSGPAFLLDCGFYSVLADNYMHGLRLPDSGAGPATDRSCLIRMRKPGCPEGHHSLVRYDRKLWIVS